MPESKGPRTVLVTGGAAGIGAAVSRCFGNAGWRVICHYHSSEKKAAALKEAIEASGSSCRIVWGDLTGQVGIKDFLTEVSDEKVDSLVNNAGAYVAAKELSALSYDDLIETFSINTFAPFLLCGVFFPKMRERGFGRIINVSSIAAKYGGSLHSVHYGCSKRALEGLTLTLGKKGAPHGVLVNTVRPGVIDTGFHLKYPKDMSLRIDMIPVKRIGLADEVARMIYFLGSEENTFITRETISVAGGE